MKTKILVTIVTVLFIGACGKDKYETKPQLKYKSVNTNTLSRNQSVSIRLEVTDAEGDIQDTLGVQIVVPRCPNTGFTARYPVPNFTSNKNFKGEIEVCYAYGLNQSCPSLKDPQCNRNDTATFRFWIQDKAKNVSDTITGPTVVLLN